MVEARESQRDMMRLAALEDVTASASSSSVLASAQLTADQRPYLDLSVRKNLQAVCSTVTSLESLASSIDISDIADKNLKRSREHDIIITSVEKDSQVKEQRGTFRGLFPAGDNTTGKGSPKKSRHGNADVWSLIKNLLRSSTISVAKKGQILLVTFLEGQ